MNERNKDDAAEVQTQCNYGDGIVATTAGFSAYLRSSTSGAVYFEACGHCGMCLPH